MPSAVALLEGRMAEVSRAVNAESARWGDIFAGEFYGRPQWEAQTSFLRSSFFTQRGPIVRQRHAGGAARGAPAATGSGATS